MIGYTKVSLQCGLNSAWTHWGGYAGINRVGDVSEGYALVTDDNKVKAMYSSIIKLWRSSCARCICVISSLLAPFDNGLNSAKRTAKVIG